MKKTDFLFVYEVKSRELENICLIRCELERRGYSVEFVETWQYVNSYHEPVDARVVISFAMYNDKVFDYISSFAYQLKKLVNLQWEQIYSHADEHKDSIYTIKGKARNAVHICWGHYTAGRLKSMGIRSECIALTGHVGMDFLRPEFDGYYLSRDEICTQFKIQKKKKLHLFISSFAYVGMLDSTLNSELYQSTATDPFEFRSISEQSQKEILAWFSRVLSEGSNDIMIYRPHPAEVNNPLLVEFSHKYSNFIVIGEYSVKQWIKVADKIYTWYSTSIAEVYAAGKDCAILRPLSIPNEMDMPIYDGAKFISTFEGFAGYFFGDREMSSLEADIFDRFYYRDQHEASYKKVSDVLENVLKNDQYHISSENIRPNKSLPYSRRILYQTKMSIIKMLGIVNRLPIGKRLLESIDMKYGKVAEAYNFSQELAMKNRSTRKEIAAIEARIGSVTSYSQRGKQEE